MRIVIFDFDGTLTTGDETAMRYAEEAAQSVPAAARNAYLSDIRRDFRAKGSDRWPGALDGFDQVRLRAIEHGAKDESLNGAYLRSRKAMGSGEVDVSGPQGLAEFLSGLPAYRIVVTNSPSLGLVEALTTLGILHCIDEIHTNVGKPDGLKPIIRNFTEQIGAGNVLSIGDIWNNDLAPARALGCPTALITHGRAANWPATFTVEELPGLYESVLQWARATDHSSQSNNNQPIPAPHTEKPQKNSNRNSNRK